MKIHGTFCLLTVLLMTIGHAQTASVTNVTASQRTDGSKLVDIYYDLAEDTLFYEFLVTVEISFDGGATYTPTNYVSGDVGAGITAGTGKHIVWNLGAEYGETYSDQVKVKVIATGRLIEVPFEFVLVDSGEYTYGWNDEIRLIDYDYEIMKYEVTNAEYVQYLLEATESGEVWLSGDNIRGFYSGDEHNSPGEYTLLNFWAGRISWNGTTFIVEEGYGDHPVTGISWFGAYKFAEYYGLRLPTEEEWEKAARGNTGWDYPWGDQMDSSRANFYASGDPYDNGTTPVGYYSGDNHDGYQTIDSPSPYGAYDMAGNVFDWTASWWDEYSSDRVIRGGNWQWNFWDCQSHQRNSGYPDWVVNYSGFRCVRDISPTRARMIRARHSQKLNKVR
jgi:formylglycine-generating enzyme required for sulfatase activity